MKAFTIHLLHGRKEIVTGHDISDACRRAGIGAGALRALNYWEEVSEPEQADVDILDKILKETNETT